MRSAHFLAPGRLQNKRAGKPHGSLPLITVGCCHCRTPNWSSPPIAYTSYSLAMLPIFSNVPCTIISVNRLNYAVVIIARVHHFQRVVKPLLGFWVYIRDCALNETSESAVRYTIDSEPDAGMVSGCHPTSGLK